MKRTKFLFALTALAVAPLTVLSRVHRRLFTPGKAIRVASGEDRFGKPISLFEGDTFFTKVATEDSGGGLYIFESSREKKGGPPLHYHYTQDEWWYVLEGEFLFKVGDETFTAKKGDSVFGPRMVPHAFAKINEGPARLVMAFQPADKMEEHFKAVSGGALAKLSAEEKYEFRKANGFEVTGPALTYEKN